MTLSIAGRCPETGMLGGAVTSSSICVASRCLFTRAGVGAALTQNVTDPSLGDKMLNLLESVSDANSAYPKSYLKQIIFNGDSLCCWTQWGVPLSIQGKKF